VIEEVKLSRQQRRAACREEAKKKWNVVMGENGHVYEAPRNGNNDTVLSRPKRRKYASIIASDSFKKVRDVLARTAPTK
jgi:hypothetical protein